MTYAEDTSMTSYFEHSGKYRSGATSDPRNHADASCVTATFHPKAESQQAIKLIAKEFPRIHKTITSCWGTELLSDKLQFMLNVDTENRQGFPFDIANALMIVAMQHSREFNHEPKPEVQLRAMYRPDRW